jgi:hypothetical protein
MSTLASGSCGDEAVVLLMVAPVSSRQKLPMRPNMFEFMALLRLGDTVCDWPDIGLAGRLVGWLLWLLSGSCE